MEVHNSRKPFCDCDTCEARRAISRYDAMVDADTEPMIFNFTATQLGVYLQMALEYKKGVFD